MTLRLAPLGDDVAAAVPGRAAVSRGGLRLSYAELDRGAEEHHA